MNRNDDGLTLVEMMVALLVLGVVLTAMASVSIASMISMQRSERVVDSTQLGNEILEEVLALPFEVVGLYDTEATGHFGDITFEGEDLVLFPDPTGDRDERVPYPTHTVTRNDITFEVETAVTWVDDPATPTDQDYKRITILLTWEVRGDERTARTEATRSPEPEEQPLAVTVAPDVLEIRSDGAAEDFEVSVTAREPQSTVRVRWTKRDGTLSPWRDLTATDVHKLEWRRSITDNAESARFANGGSLLEIEGTSAANEKVTTTIGRAVFLHPLALPADRLTTAPDTIWVHADDGVCDPLEVHAEVIGALKSDPLTLTFEGETEADSHPFRAVSGLVDGAEYELEVAPEDVRVATDVDGNPELRFELLLLRAVDPHGPDGAELRQAVVMENVQELAEGEPCPA